MSKVILLSLTGSLLLAACSSPLPTYYYQLDALVKAPLQTASTQTKQQVIGIGPTTLPTLLNRKSIVTRTPTQTIQIATTQQWAEPLLENIPRVIARNLTALQPNRLFHLYPWSAFGPVDLRIIIEVFQFDAQLGKSVIFEAAWSIKDEHNQQILKQSRTQLERPLKSDSYAEMITHMNEILGTFSRELSEALVAM